MNNTVYFTLLELEYDFHTQIKHHVNTIIVYPPFRVLACGHQCLAQIISAGCRGCDAAITAPFLAQICHLFTQCNHHI